MDCLTYKSNLIVCIIFFIFNERKEKTNPFTLSPEEYKVGILANEYQLKINANQQIFDENNYEWL